MRYSLFIALAIFANKQLNASDTNMLWRKYEPLPIIVSIPEGRSCIIDEITTPQEIAESMQLVKRVLNHLPVTDLPGRVAEMSAKHQRALRDNDISPCFFAKATLDSQIIGYVYHRIVQDPSICFRPSAPNNLAVTGSYYKGLVSTLVCADNQGIVYFDVLHKLFHAPENSCRFYRRLTICCPDEITALEDKVSNLHTGYIPIGIIAKETDSDTP